MKEQRQSDCCNIQLNEKQIFTHIPHHISWSKRYILEKYQSNEDIIIRGRYNSRSYLFSKLRMKI